LLRAEALRAAGEFATAGGLLQATGQLDEANRLFWLADQLPGIDLNSGLKFDRVIQTTQDLSTPPSRLPETPLADAANLLRDSAETRQRITELFTALEQE